MKPHKHAELIKAWADGAEIEFYGDSDEWLYIKEPSWKADIKYRVKPKKPTRYLVVKELSNGSIFVNQSLPHEDVEKYFKLHEFVQEHETDWDNQYCEVFKNFDENYKVILCGTYPSLGTMRMSEQCAEKLCDMLNNGEIEL